MLGLRGYRVLEAASAAAAVAALSAAGSVDIVVTDIIMPGQTGDQLAAQLRQAHPGLKVLFISGYNDAPLAGKLGDPHAFLSKPFSADALERTVRAVLEGQDLCEE